MKKIELVILLLVFPVASFGKIKCDDSEFKKLPIVKQRCQGEGCADIFPTFVGDDIKLHVKPNKKSKIVDVLKKCELLGNFETREVIEKLGKAKITSESKGVSFKKGEEVIVLSKSFEGYFSVCKGDVVKGAASPGYLEPKAPEGYLRAEIITPIESTSWIKVITPRGKSGYALLSDKAIIRNPRADKRVDYCEKSKSNKDHDLKGWEVTSIKNYKVDFQKSLTMKSSTVHFKNQTVMDTKIYEVELIQAIKMEKGAPLLILKGRVCTMCDANTTIHIVKASEKDVNLSSVRYSYPGKVSDYMDGSAVSHYRAFYGDCISEIGNGIFWFDALSKNHSYVSFTGTELKLKAFKKNVDIKNILKRVKGGKCTEVDPINTTSEP